MVRAGPSAGRRPAPVNGVTLSSRQAPFGTYSQHELPGAAQRQYSRADQEHHHDRALSRTAVGLGAQDELMRGGQFHSWVDAQDSDESASNVVESDQRLGLAAIPG